MEKASGRTTATSIDADLWTRSGSAGCLPGRAGPARSRPAPGEDMNLPEGQTGRPYLPFRSLASLIAASHGVAGDAASVARWGYALAMAGTC